MGDLGPLLGAVHGALRPDGLFAFTVETTTDAPYRLEPTRRYAHDPESLREMAGWHGFSVVSVETATLRLEAGKAVASAVMVLKRERAPGES